MDAPGGEILGRIEIDGFHFHSITRIPDLGKAKAQ
jgi:hypothetical protein